MVEWLSTIRHGGDCEGVSGWGCPHEHKGDCMRVEGHPCDPGMRGCVLHGRFAFSDPEKNSPRQQRRLETRHGNGLKESKDGERG